MKKAAELHLKAASSPNPQGPVALLSAANCYFFLGRYKEALETVEKLLEDYPNLYQEAAEEAEWIKGKCFMALGYSKDKVIAQFKRIIEKYPDTRVAAGAYMEIMEIHLRSGAQDLAMKEWEEIVAHYKQKFPNIVSMSISRWGNFFFEKGDYEEAIKWYSKALDIVPQFASRVLIRVGECYKAMEQYEKAAGIFQEVADKFPQSEQCPQALLLQGQCLYQMGKKKEAKDVFIKLLEKFPTKEEIIGEAKNWIELCEE
ncbi:tetratricopeptide repeat protein [bacterium]|nr:tetratricopeptide repeat protein [bacterium]